MFKISKKKGFDTKPHSKSGFTLMELIVVIAIAAVLVIVFSPSLLRHTETSRMQKDDSAMDELCNAIQIAMSDSATFDEVCAYAIANNCTTYTDSSGIFGNQYQDEEYWAPDGNGYAVTITFNPDANGNYVLADGVINDMGKNNGSIDISRTDNTEKQGTLGEMGNSNLYNAIKQTIGTRLSETSATYKNSSYTVFIKLENINGIYRANVYGQHNGTNLSEHSTVSTGSGIEVEPPVNNVTPEQPGNNSGNNNVPSVPDYSNSDLMGSGGGAGSTYQPPVQNDPPSSDPIGGETPPEETLPDVTPSGPTTETPVEPPHEHSYTSIVTPPTCTTAGYTTHTCSCGDSYQDSNVNAKGHTFSVATCIAAKKCNVCGATEGSANGHNFKEATCTEPKTCNVCGATEGSAKGHNWTNANCTTARTCTVCGMTEGTSLGHNYSAATCTSPKTCTSCGATEGTARGHTYSTATCTKAKTCTVCGVTEVTALGHKWQAATCTAAKKCSVCGATEGSAKGHTWKNATCTTPKTCTTCNATSGSAKGHTWVAATCTTPKKCSVCNTTSGSATGHTWIAATCTKAKTCSKCNTTEGSAAGHSYTAATCTKPKTCTRCGVTSGSSLGHSWTAATCTVPKTCSRCGTTSGSAKGHSYTTKVVAPTFSAKGYTLHTCKTCGHSYKDTYVDKLPTPDVTFGNNSWANIQKIVAAGKFSETGWKVGDTKSVTINGVSLTVRIIGVNHDGNNTITLMCTKSIGMHLFNEAVNGSSTNAGGWKDSDMREWLNGTIYNGLSSDLKSAIKSVSKKTNNVGNGDKTATATATTDKLFLLSLAEANITHTFDTDGEGTAYQYFVNTKYNLRGWFRSPRIDSPKNFCDFNNSNTIGSNYAAYPNANVIPAFVIG